MTVNGMMIVTMTVLIIITLIVAKSVVCTKASQVNNVDKSMFLDNIVVGLNCYNLLNCYSLISEVPSKHTSTVRTVSFNDQVASDMFVIVSSCHCDCQLPLSTRAHIRETSY